ncbi:hypothetical protein EVA_03962, partial [gut metagenome]
MSAQTEVKSLSDITNNKTFTLVTKRGYVGVKDAKAVCGYAPTDQ